MSRVRAGLAATIVAVGIACGSEAFAESEAWSRMAADDLKAAYELLLETHPGAEPARGDAVFLQDLRRGYQEAQALAASARTFGGYRAALERFAAGFNDPHIQTSSLVQADRSWPGVIVSDRSGEWSVVASEGAQHPPVGARLIACDGAAPDELARARLAPFTSAWSVRAQRVRASRELLVDTGNPKHPRLKSCSFRLPDGSTLTHELRWRRISTSEFNRRVGATSRAASEDVAMRPFEGGWWIRLGTLSGAAVPIVQEAVSRQAELRSSPFVVVDLRGNGGGASFLSDRIARVILGASAVQRARAPRGAERPEAFVWRASPRTLETANAYVERVQRMAPAGDPLVGGMIAQRDAITAALAAARPLAEGPGEAGVDPKATAADVVRRPPRVILITDRFCFSSCVAAALLFRDLGALHVGEETNANTHYSNLLQVDLPSGLSTFSSLQAYSTHMPRQLGPYAPSVVFNGDLADDAAVEAWIKSTLPRR